MGGEAPHGPCALVEMARVTQVRLPGYPWLLRDHPADGAVEGASAGELACSRQVSKKRGTRCNRIPLCVSDILRNYSDTTSNSTSTVTSR